MTAPVVDLHCSNSLSSSLAQGARQSSWLDRFVAVVLKARLSIRFLAHLDTGYCPSGLSK